MSATLSPGFADPVEGAQTCFRAVLDAMARPGTTRSAGGPEPPAPLSPAAGAVLLALADLYTPVAIGPAFAAARAWIAFHTGAAFADDPADAVFVLSDGLPDLARLNAGTHESPETSATAIVQVRSLSDGAAFRLSGPGIETTSVLRVDGLPADFAARWRANRAAFPRGVDLILCAGDTLAAIPRGTAVEDA